MNTKKLPNKPSKLILLALKDLELVEKDERYAVNMHTWHRPKDGICQVCLAGSVLAKSLKFSNEEYTNGVYFESNFEKSEGEKLSFLDRVRMKSRLMIPNIYFQIEDDVKVKLSSEIYELPYTNYESNPSEFKTYLRELAKIFKKYNY